MAPVRVARGGRVRPVRFLPALEIVRGTARARWAGRASVKPRLGAQIASRLFVPTTAQNGAMNTTQATAASVSWPASRRAAAPSPSAKSHRNRPSRAFPATPTSSPRTTCRPHACAPTHTSESTAATPSPGRSSAKSSCRHSPRAMAALPSTAKCTLSAPPSTRRMPMRAVSAPCELATWRSVMWCAAWMRQAETLQRQSCLCTITCCQAPRWCCILSGRRARLCVTNSRAPTWCP
mmetsp:Transcript_8383/g.13285  ORF Transcript_8383/g.13285 Transcript_8383/m.13285 type:complete len:236 (+) Transcript_8383:512-1219(+)